MNKEYTPSAGWNKAALTGLVMGLATIVAAQIQGLASLAGGFAGSLLSFVLMIAKIAACIWLFKGILLRFTTGFDGITRKNLVGYGLKVALFSALVVSAFSVVEMLYIRPDTYAEAISQMREAYSAVMDSNSLMAMEKILPKFPLIMFVTSMVYCFIWGWALTGIFAGRMMPDDPFSDVFGNKGVNGGEKSQDSE
ncbi:MAG: DUF4199 domain-containing protein [Candidatus Cryptobacteroides sp.]